VEPGSFRCDKTEGRSRDELPSGMASSTKVAVALADELRRSQAGSLEAVQLKKEGQWCR